MIRVQYRRGVSLDTIAAEHGLPPGSVRLVARPSRWGNPFRVDLWGHAAVLMFHQQSYLRRNADPAEFLAWLAPLRAAEALACYCAPGEPCHADVLIQLLAETEEGARG